MIKRDIFCDICNNLFQDKVILIFGTRRVGKTTLLKELLKQYKDQGKKCVYLNCDLLTVRQSLETQNEQELWNKIKDYEIVIIDEAQNVSNIGMTLKIMHDEFPQIQVIAAASSRFDLGNMVGEPLVGRNITYELYPFSAAEIKNHYDPIFMESNIDQFLKFGMYPCIWGAAENIKKRDLNELVNGYLFKDVLAFEKTRHSGVITRLLQCLALQIGSEVSYRELSQKIEIPLKDVKTYIDLLERCFIIFSLPALSRNMRNEISGNRSHKIYFYDIGIRNALLNAYEPMNLRMDIGGIWENFCISELFKKSQREGRFCNRFFWRNYDKQEVDFIEEENGQFIAYEFKYRNNRRVKLPRSFADNYNVSKFKVITKENFLSEIAV